MVGVGNVLLALVAAPLLPGVINRVKAGCAGRTGPPLLQLYYDLGKLLRKGAVYSHTTTWVFRASPVVALAAAILAVLIVPLAARPAPLAFAGDFVLLAYILGVARFFTVVGALDTGSPFEGMGASREVLLACLAEPVLFLSLAALVVKSGSLSLSGVMAGASHDLWTASGPTVILVVGALLVVFLTENSRMPIDDPTTHLELTMIHEVMVLDHGGIDLAYILYGAALKLWVLGALMVGLVVPGSASWQGSLLGLAGLLGLAVMTGCIESTLARLRLIFIPRLLLGAAALAVVALILAWR